MRQLLVHFLVFVLAIGFPGALSAESMTWIGQRGEKKWQPHFEFSFRSGNHDRYGLELDPFIPIAQDDHSLWFLNVRSGRFWVDNDVGHEINAGGGYRRIMGESWILGGYGFFDRIQTTFDNHFNQGTLGIEALSLNWDLRFNGYIADSTPKSASGAGGGGVQLVGTTLSMNSAVEQALSGFDGELGWRLPFSPDSLLGDTRLYVGGFFFEGSDVSSIGGPRTRFEMRIHDIPFLWEGSRITLGADYTWDDVRGSEVTSLVGLRIPFGAPSKQQSLTPLDRRMTDRVVRDVSIVTNMGGGSEPVQNAAGVAIGETLFFDSAGGGDGSFTAPLDLPTAIPTGGANALLIGLDSTGNITGLSETLLEGQTVMGGGTSILLQGVNSGNTALFTPSGSPSIFSGGVAPTLILARNNAISGLTFTGMSEALRLAQSGGSSTTSILGNTFDTVGTGLNASWSGSFDATLNLQGNTFQGGTNGLLADLAPDGSSGPSSFDLALSGNTFDSLSSAIGVNVSVSGSEDYSHRSAISGNTFSFNGNDYELDLDGSGASGSFDIDVAVNSNSSTGAGNNFTNVYVGSVPSGHVDLEITDNDIEDAEGHAINIDLYSGPDLDATIAENRIDTTGGDGIHVDVYASGSLNGHSLTINDNTIEYTDDDGIDVYFGYGYDATIAINDNTIQYVYGDGIAAQFYGNGHDAGDSAAINGNTVQYVNDDGIDVYFGYGYDATVTIDGNTVQYVYGGYSDDGDYGYYGDGVEVDFSSNGHAAGNVATISNNEIRYANDDGIDVYFGYGYDADVTINDNTIQYVYGDGIEADFYGNGHDTGDSATINGNTVQYAYGAGIDVYFGYGYDANVTINDNTIQYVYGDGIAADFYYNGHDVGNSATINGNTIQYAYGDGIDVYLGYGYDTNVTIADNTVQYVDGDGIRVYSYYVGHDLGNTLGVSGNYVIDAGDDGIDVYAYNGYAYYDPYSYSYSYYGYDTAVTIADNQIDASGSYGINLYGDAMTELSSDVGGSILDNVVMDSGLADVYLDGSYSGSIRVNGIDLP